MPPARLFAPGRIAALAATLLAVPAVAQTPITITAADFVVTPNTVYYWQQLQAPTPGPGPAPAIATGDNLLWDYRNFSTPQGVPFTNATRQVPPPNAAFPLATVGQRYLNSLGPLQVQGMQYNGYSADGYVSFGSVLARQAFAIGVLTGSNRDSVVVLGQTLQYPQPEVIQQLPVTMGSVTSATRRTVTRATITVTNFGLINAPVLYVQRQTVSDSIVGWGALQIPVAGQPNGSAPIPVLLSRSQYMEQDSFYVNGQPAPALLLGALNLTQGVTSMSLGDRFLRAGSPQSVMVVNYIGSNRTQANYFISNEAGLPLRVAPLVADADAALWPNPVAAGQAVRLTINGLTEPATIFLRDALGRTVHTARLRSGADALTLPADLAPGHYLLTATLPDGRLLRRGLAVE